MHGWIKAELGVVGRGLATLLASEPATTFALSPQSPCHSPMPKPHQCLSMEAGDELPPLVQK